MIKILGNSKKSQEIKLCKEKVRNACATPCTSGYVKMEKGQQLKTGTNIIFSTFEKYFCWLRPYFQFQAILY